MECPRPSAAIRNEPFVLGVDMLNVASYVLVCHVPAANTCGAIVSATRVAVRMCFLIPVSPRELEYSTAWQLIEHYLDLVPPIVFTKSIRIRRLMNPKIYPVAIAFFVLSVIGFAGCAEFHAPLPYKLLVDPTYDEVKAEANKHERVMVDGWYFGELPRIFKSPYGQVSVDDKVKFAIAQAEFLKASKQDMAKNIESYVTYSKRAAFAEKWWQESDKAKLFAEQPEKFHILWLQESLMDGSELWWRALEDKNRATVDAMRALAHDEEQKRVSKFLDVEGQPRSLSDMVDGK